MKVIVNNQTSNSVTVNNRATSEVVSIGIQGPAGPSRISTADDVDSTDLRNGSVLVYKTNSNKWTSTTTLDAQNMDGGEF